MNRKIGWMLLLLALAIYLPSLFVYWVHPGHWWPMGILSIGFPYTWSCMTIMVVLAFVLKRKTGWLVLVLWATGGLVMRHVWGTTPVAGFDSTRGSGQLRVMQWNCMELSGSAKNDSTRQVRKNIVAFLKQYDPEVLLLQDFQEINSANAYSNIALLRDTLGYRHMHFVPFYHIRSAGGETSEGSAIFSKIPLDTVAWLSYDGRRVPDHVVWADIHWQGKPLRLVSTHLHSMNLNTPPGQPDPLYYYHHEDSAVITSGSVWRKLRYHQPYHVRQAYRLKQFLDTSSLPLVLGIDMNSVPSSYAYHHISRELQDVFLCTGWGWGRSYHSRLPNMRIDYLFTATEFNVLQAVTVPVAFSDHFPIIADIRWHPL